MYFGDLYFVIVFNFVVKGVFSCYFIINTSFNFSVFNFLCFSVIIVVGFLIRIIDFLFKVRKKDYLLIYFLNFLSCFNDFGYN